MRDSLILFAHLLGIVVRPARPGGLRSVVAESVLVRHQLLIWYRGRKRQSISISEELCSVEYLDATGFLAGPPRWIVIDRVLFAAILGSERVRGDTD